MLAKVKSLKFGDGSKPLTPEEKGTLEWQRKLGEAVNDVEEWGGAAEKTQEDYFHQKSSLYRALLEVTPEGVARERRRELRQILARDRRAPGQPHRVDAAREIPARQSARGRQGGAQVLETLTNSGDATLQLYSDFQRLSS